MNIPARSPRHITAATDCDAVLHDDMLECKQFSNEDSLPKQRKLEYSDSKDFARTLLPVLIIIMRNQ